WLGRAWRKSATSAPVWGKIISWTVSWWWCWVAWATSSARSRLHSASESPTRFFNPGSGRSWAKSSFSPPSSCSCNGGPRDCSSRGPVALKGRKAEELPFMTRVHSKKELLALGVFAFVGLVVLPCLNAFVPPTSLFHISNFTISLYGKYLCYAVLAIGVNLLWGYTGLLSLGQAL